jgi:parallel beta-helix repeat protein
MRLALGIAVAVALVAFLGTARASTTARVVDDNGLQCPSAAYTDIQSAVDAANPGDTVVVCPGTYAGATIDKQLIVRGFTPDLSNASKCQDATTYPGTNTSKNSIIDGGTLAVGASRVTITGFTIQNTGDGIDVPGNLTLVGITKNLFQGDVIGINLNGGMMSADHNCFRGNGPTGTGIYSDQGLSAARIVSNAFFENGDAGITLIGDGTGSLDGVLIQKNTSYADGDLVSISGSTDSTIEKNTATAALGSAAYIESGNANLSITGNTFNAGEDEGIAIDAFTDPGLPTAGTKNVGLTVSNNKIKSGATAHADAGIAVYLDSLDGSTFTKNTVNKNGYDGLFVADGNSGNLFENNDLKGNQVIGAGFDCHDDTTGGGTAGTDNTWTKNKGKTSSPSGLCKK